MSTATVPQRVLDSVYGSKPEDWHQHAKGGGWVYKTARVEESAYLHPTSIVSGNARVFGNAWVSGDARVFGNAWVSGHARVFGDARVFGNAWVSGNARVYGNAWVSGHAWVSGDAWKFSPLYIQGSRHALTLCSLSQIAIGCHVHNISEWLKKYEAIGRAEGYTKEQIEEYGAHLKYMAGIAERLQKQAIAAAEGGAR